MSILTAALMGALALYLGGWYAGLWLGNFAALLMLLTVVTGVFWGLEKLRFRPQRVAAVAQLDREMQERQQSLEARGIVHDAADSHGAARQKLLMQPWWLDWTAGLFPVILAVFILRSFLFEPFKIPSGSMIPTLAIGDLILVNKYEYGLRLPVFNTKLWANKEPARGDVIVFRYPEDPSVDYIKRVIGLPGDTVDYTSQRLTLNGQLVPVTSLGQYLNPETLSDMPVFEEDLPG
ncbi:signal peptidase I, partial [Amphibiibacter pelophylacis]